eukprot:172163-Rhodomonas_salina.3
MNKVVVAVFLLAKVFHATSNVLAGRVANDCAPILLQPSPGSPISFGQDITVTVEPGCCHTESRKLEDCIVAVFTDAVFEGFAAAFDDESAELKLTLPRFGMSNLGGHVISIAECGRGQVRIAIAVSAYTVAFDANIAHRVAGGERRSLKT